MRKRRMTRRGFLRASATAGLGASIGAPLLLHGCTEANPFLPPEILLPTAPTDRPATVAVARGTELTAMTHDLLTRLGGIETVVRPGETVFIKPNLLAVGLGRENPIATGECAKPEIVTEVADACLQAGAAEVIIGDGAQVVRFSWEEVVTLDGTSHLAAEVARLNTQYDNRVRLACLNDDSPAWDAVPTPRTGHGELLVSSLVARADRLISIPVLKTHRHAGLSLSLKNLIGTMPLAGYGGVGETHWRVDLHTGAGRIDGCILDVAAAVDPDLVIIDASIGVERNGPWVYAGEGVTVDLRERAGQWLLLGSTDAVAADVTAARIIGHDPRTIDHLRRAVDEGLGQGQADLITLAGVATLDELRVEWEPMHEPTLGEVIARAERPY